MEDQEFRLLMAAKTKYEEHKGHVLALKLTKSNLVFGPLVDVEIKHSSIVLTVDLGLNGFARFFGEQVISCACEVGRQA